MENNIIRKEDGTIMKWDKSNNNTFCLLYNDNRQKYYFTPTQDLTCSIFMIGGGGAGGYFFGGGGGAGAAYINDNFIFKKNVSYSFEVGIGGKCDIDNINNLFQSGLSLKVYNNTTPKLTNINFSGDDYSSLGITSAGIIQSYITENINIPATIFNNNTTYIWDGYIKPNNNFIKIAVNSKIKVIIWVDKIVYDNTSAIVDGINVNDVKVIELDTNKYFNIKIIAYNFDTAKTDFNIKFENCQLFNYNKNGEIYNYTQATDTNIVYRTEDNKSYIIKCKGGGNGGCGFYNQNKNLDGGCGGGSGINKKNGKAIVDPSFNGNDGAIGTYCGGGGGIISPGNDNKGGKGKIIEWFNKDIIFGAGGNGATFKEERKLGYGSGGNGAECCQFSKLAIDNDGNNGCILIYIKNLTEKNNVIEGFTSKSATYYNTDSIVNKLITESFAIIKNSSTTINTNIDRSTYFNSIGQTFAELCYDDMSDATFTGPNKSLVDGHNNMNNFIYDMIIASKLFGVIYRLYYHHFTTTLNSDIALFEKFASNVSIKFTNDASTTSITSTNSTHIASINSLFNIANLNLTSSTSNYKTSIYFTGTTSNALNIAENVYDIAKKDIGDIEVPVYHNAYINTDNVSDTTGSVISGLSNWYTNNSNFINKINAIESTDSKICTSFDNICSTTAYNSISTIQAQNKCTESSDIIIPLNYSTNYLNKLRLQEIYNNSYPTLNANTNKYEYQRILFHLENFNIILNTNPTNLLNTLKYYMYYYNAVVYNVILQYDLFKLQQDRITNYKGQIKANATNAVDSISYYNSSSAYSESPSPVKGYKINSPEDSKLNTTTITNDIATLSSNLNRICQYNINSSIKYTELTTNISNNTNNIKTITLDFDNYQTKYNKVVNIYNNDLDSYNSINTYYKAVIIIAIIIIIAAIFLFSIRRIDGNAQTGILLITAIIMILFYIFYLANLKITETFVNCRYKTVPTTAAVLSGNVDFLPYKEKLYTYNAFLFMLSTSESITSDTLKPMNNFIANTNNMRQQKILFYKSKIAEYTNASELLKKGADNYYYLMTLIYFTIIIALFAMAFNLLFPTMVYSIMIFAIIIFLILLIYIVYKINRSTRLFNDKNYWANFNPSNEVIQSL
jgi:hypothetical protein